MICDYRPANRMKRATFGDKTADPLGSELSSGVGPRYSRIHSGLSANPSHRSSPSAGKNSRGIVVFQGAGNQPGVNNCF
jgi:hypothetical protein